MRKRTKSILFAAVMAIPALAFGIEKAGKFSDGEILLKNGESLKGLVAPLGDFPASATVFKLNEQAKKTKIAYDQISSVTYQGTTYIPAVIRVDGRLVSAYMEQVESGPARLYKAYYYAPKKQGKNNQVTQLQWSWVVSTSIKGTTVLGRDVKASQLLAALDHPKVTMEIEPQILDEAALKNYIEVYNSQASAVMQ